VAALQDQQRVQPRLLQDGAGKQREVQACAETGGEDLVREADFLAAGLEARGGRGVSELQPAQRQNVASTMRSTRARSSCW
jgi:hypothetical protein